MALKEHFSGKHGAISRPAPDRLLILETVFVGVGLREAAASIIPPPLRKYETRTGPVIAVQR